MRDPLFSVTASDCRWAYTRGSGSGGQKRNKTSNAVHCTHEPSGAHGYAEDHREQRKNRELAFDRMAKSPRFQLWLRHEINRRTGLEREIKRRVEMSMRPENLKVETFVPENGHGQ